jgi:hypothetical protein
LMIWGRKAAIIAPIAVSLEVDEDDCEKFVKLVLEEFENLHGGNAIRFDIRPLELAALKGNIKTVAAPKHIQKRIS